MTLIFFTPMAPGRKCAPNFRQSPFFRLSRSLRRGTYLNIGHSLNSCLFFLQERSFETACSRLASPLSPPSALTLSPPSTPGTQVVSVSKVTKALSVDESPQHSEVLRAPTSSKRLSGYSTSMTQHFYGRSSFPILKAAQKFKKKPEFFDCRR